MDGAGWDADPSAQFSRRLGISPKERFRGTEPAPSGERNGCPDIWELDNGDVAVIGRDLTDSYRSRLPEGVGIRDDERLVVVPRVMVVAAKPDIPDA